MERAGLAGRAVRRSEINSDGKRNLPSRPQVLDKGGALPQLKLSELNRTGLTAVCSCKIDSLVDLQLIHRGFSETKLLGSRKHDNLEEDIQVSGTKRTDVSLLWGPVRVLSVVDDTALVDLRKLVQIIDRRPVPFEPNRNDLLGETTARRIHVGHVDTLNTVVAKDV